jgi:hypothetical protein
MKPLENQFAPLSVESRPIVIDPKTYLILGGVDANLNASSLLRVAARVVKNHSNELI